MSDEPPEFIQLMDELEAHPFQEISDRLNHITYVLYILERNFDILSDFVDEHVTHEQFIFDDPLSRKLKIRKELYRLLHNYLASYYTQYSFTKSLRDAKLDAAGQSTYDDLVMEHDIRPTSDFLKAIRNWMQHEVLVDAGPVYHWNKETGVDPIELKVFREDIEKLNQSYANQGVQAFLEAHGKEEVSLLSVVKEHHPDLLAFHEDFRKLLIDEHEDELEEYIELQGRMNEATREALGTE